MANFLLLLLAGCGRTVYPGDGTAVGLEPDPEVEAATCAGGHWWDVAGADVHCHIGVARWKIPVRVSSLGTDLNGEYQWSGVILLRPDASALTAAHEIGHAIGLDHITAPGVMDAQAVHEDALTDADLAEHRRVWGR